jgi:hypothetical protein
MDVGSNVRGQVPLSPARTPTSAVWVRAIATGFDLERRRHSWTATHASATVSLRRLFVLQKPRRGNLKADVSSVPRRDR